MLTHPDFMQKAYQLATVRLGFCSPNPSVGAVVVKEGRILAEGYHNGPGTLHAEPDALSKVDDEARGASIYVTLEPCCTHGRTPPCTDLLIKRGIKKVFFASYDPNPNVAGKGIQALEAAGIVCEHLALPEINKLYESYAYWHKSHFPWVIAKLSLSLDGKIALCDAERAAISSEKLNQLTHQRRKNACAILTTAKTILADNPKLNVRLGSEVISKPLYIIDRELKLTGREQIFNTAESICIFCDKNRLMNESNKSILPHVRYMPVMSNHDYLDWQEILKIIGADGKYLLWVEAGAQSFETLALSGLLSQAMLYYSPKILGTHAYAGLKNPKILREVVHIDWQSIEQESICHLFWIKPSFYAFN